MRKLIAIASVAIMFQTFGATTFHTWFDMDIKDISGLGSGEKSWPTDGSDYTATYCIVTNTSAATFSDKHIIMESDDPLVVNPDGPAAINDSSYAEITTKMRVTPFLESGLPDIPEEAKTAVIAVDSGDKTNFWVAAGLGELYWTNTLIAADVNRDIEVKIIASNSVDGVCTEWKFDDASFMCEIPKASVLSGVTFRGEGAISECGGDVWNLGTCYFFKIDGVPSELSIVVTNGSGDVIYPGKNQAYQEVGYTCAKDAVLGLSFFTPEGWAFWDGTNEWTEVYANIIDNNVFTPCDGYGINPSDFGPIGGWAVMRSRGEDEDPEFIGRYTSTDEALSVLKDHCGLMPFYSETEHVIAVAENGSSVTIDGVEITAGDRYHYLDADGVPMLLINDGEADITSVAEDATDAAYMSIGSILNTFSGFDYSVIYADDVGFTEGLGETEPVKGNDGKLELKAPKGDAGKRFYRIRITD